MGGDWGWNEIFAGMGWDRMEVLQERAGMEITSVGRMGMGVANNRN